MSACNDLTGKRFGRWTVIKRAENSSNNRSQWVCICDCGNVKTVKRCDLSNGRSKSCGCLRKDNTSTMFSKHNKTKTRLYRIWSCMKTRCYNTNAVRYNDWGGRGIRICNEWLNDFMTFYNWAISNGYTDKLTIDRIDNNGNYTPLNCRWATVAEQSKNRRKRKTQELHR